MAKHRFFTPHTLPTFAKLCSLSFFHPFFSPFPFKPPSRTHLLEPASAPRPLATIGKGKPGVLSSPSTSSLPPSMLYLIFHQHYRSRHRTHKLTPPTPPPPTTATKTQHLACITAHLPFLSLHVCSVLFEKHVAAIIMRSEGLRLIIKVAFV